MSVAIIVLNYNNPISTIRCLNSFKLLLEGDSHFETILVDNGSIDNSVSQIRLNYPELNIIESKKNLGFAGGNNLGIKAALKKKFTHILLLNNDTQIIDGSMLDKLIKRASDLTAPSIKFHRGGRSIVDFGGRIDWIMGRNTHLEYNSSEIPKMIPPAEYLSGTCLMVKREVFKKIGLPDEGYFLYYEDVDFCLRAKDAGYSLSVCKTTQIYHQLSETSNKLGNRKIQILAASHRRFFLHHLPIYSWPLALAFNLFLLIKASGKEKKQS